MATTVTTRPQRTTVDVVRLLLLLQSAIAVTTLIEAVVFGTAFGAPTAALPTAFYAGSLLVLTARIGRRGRWARRAALALEVLVVVWALIDLGLSVALTQRSLELVPVLTRIVLPVAIFRMLRRPHARAEFIRPERSSS